MTYPCVKRLFTAASGTALLCGGMAVPVLAQSVLEEVVVTARKREEHPGGSPGSKCHLQRLCRSGLSDGCDGDFPVCP